MNRGWGLPSWPVQPCGRAEDRSEFVRSLREEFTDAPAEVRECPSRAETLSRAVHTRSFRGRASDPRTAACRASQTRHAVHNSGARGTGRNFSDRMFENWP